jgi:phosphatidylglycerophosphate synthase
MQIDDYLANLLVDNTDIFKNINPNSITAVTYILNIIILYLLLQPALNIPVLGIVLLLRFLTDILDGAVARKYNKVTVLGGIMDTCGDIMFSAIISWYLIFKLNGPLHLLPLIVAIMGVYVYCLDAVHDHSSLKNTDGHFLQSCIAHCINNTWCLFSIIFIMVLYLH